MDTFSFIVSVLLIIFLVFHVWATALIGAEAKRSRWKYPALNERFFTGVVQTISAFGLAVLGANRILDWHMAEPLVLLILSGSLLIKVAPSLLWVFLYYTDGFTDEGHVRTEDRLE